MLVRLHLALGLAVSVPLFFWALSGLVYTVSSSEDGGGAYAAIEPSRVRLGPAEALRRASDFAGHALPITALTLQQRDGRATYEAIGGLGMDSVTVDAESGKASLTAPPRPRTRFFRQAHFFYFAGRLQIPLLAAFAALSCASVLSGLLLASRRLR
jgi:uncharacterized iron-regulated membrane protein